MCRGFEQGVPCSRPAPQSVMWCSFQQGVPCSRSPAPRGCPVLPGTGFAMNRLAAPQQFCWSAGSSGTITQAELCHLLDVEEEEYYSAKCEGLGATTVMVRNICYKYSTEDVREQLRELGFEGAYDFIYVPSFRTSDANFGYFFLNLRTSEAASHLMELLEGAHFGKSKKLCDVRPAEWQGLGELREHFHKKRVTKSKTGNRPIFL